MKNGSLRHVPVKHLNRKQCVYLLVHDSRVDPIRRQAYLLKSRPGNGAVYFRAAERAVLKQAIREGI